MCRYLHAERESERERHDHRPEGGSCEISEGERELRRGVRERERE